MLAIGLVPTFAFATGTATLSADGGLVLTTQGEGDGFDSAGVQTGLKDVQVSAESVGIGGGGALFAPAISPHDANTFITGCDMGGIYVTHNTGQSWTRHEVCGQTMYATAFDPSRAGYVYAGSSGLSRSRDNGNTWELLWPKSADILGDPNKYEELRHYYYNTGNWNATSAIRAIAVDPDNPTHLYVLVCSYLAAYNWSLGMELYQSVDDGATFSCVGIAPYERRGIDANYEDLRVLVVGGTPYVFAQTGIYRPGSGDTLDCVYEPGGSAGTIGADRYSVVSADLMADGRIALAEALDEPPASGTYRPRTSLRLFTVQNDGTFAVAEDLSDELGVSTSDFSLECDRYTGGTTFSVAITHVRASGNRLYFINVSVVDNTSSVISLSGLCDLAQASGSRMRWIYGFPQWENFWKNDARHFDEYDIVDRGHSDTFYQHFGLATDPNNPKAFLLDTGGGCLYSDDCDFARESGGAWPSNRSNYRQLYTTSVAEGEYATTGIDEQTTYGLRQHPFNANHLAMLYTDVGLWASENGGGSWHKCDTAGVLSSNVYDLAFDQYVEGLAYSAWSSQHDAPYNKDFAKNNARGGVARSDDGGTTWTRVGSGLPDRLVPVRMALVYPTDEAKRLAGTDRTIWLATFGRGFWRSDDGGQTFAEANTGISKTSDDLILGADIVTSADGSHVFALTARGTSSQGKTAGGSHGKVYEWNAATSSWQALSWPADSDVECPKTLVWDESSSTLYVSCVAAFDRANGNIGYVNFGGGLFSYQPGDAALSAVDASSNALGATSSVEGCAVDSAGNLFVSDLRGSVFMRKAGESSFVKIYDGFHLVSKGVQLVSESRTDESAQLVGESVDSEGAQLASQQDTAATTQEDVLALPTFGGGLLRLHVKVTPEREADPDPDNPGGDTPDYPGGDTPGNPGGNTSGGTGADTGANAGANAANQTTPNAADTAAGGEANDATTAPKNASTASTPSTLAKTGDPLLPMAPLALVIAAAACVVFLAKSS